MRRNAGLHAAEQAEAIGVRPDLGEQVADHEPALASRTELPRTSEKRCVAAHRGAVHPREFRLVIEGVDVTRRAGHVQEDDPFRGAGEVRHLR